MPSRLQLVVLVLALTVASPASSATLNARTSSLLKDLTDLVRFAQHNLDLDPRSATLAPSERLSALVESLHLYGLRFPDRERLRPGMTANQIADILLRTLSMEERSSVAALAGAFLVGLRSPAASLRCTARTRKVRPPNEG